jgi:hypothetical protein
MGKLLFALGIAMLSYDASGHALATLARITANHGGAYMWNTYSTYIWPRIVDQFWYDLYWTVWHTTTIGLLVIGFIKCP